MQQRETGQESREGRHPAWRNEIRHLHVNGARNLVLCVILNLGRDFSEHALEQILTCLARQVSKTSLIAGRRVQWISTDLKSEELAPLVYRTGGGEGAGL